LRDEIKFKEKAEKLRKLGIKETKPTAKPTPTENPF
jgi:hypothetical protein